MWDRRALLLEHGCHRGLRQNVVVNVVVIDEVEDALTHMAADVRLVTVEAQALATTFLLFRRREVAESWRCGCCRLDWSAHPSRRCSRLLTRWC